MIRCRICKPCVLAWPFLVVTIMTTLLSAEEWTDVTGTKTMVAEFAGMWEEKAVFKLPDGRLRSVELMNLRAESRLRVLDLAEKKVTDKSEFVQQLRGQVEKDQAAASETIGAGDVKAPAFVEFSAQQGPADTMRYLLTQTTHGHLKAAWEILPPGQQQLFKQRIQQFYAQQDATLWDQNMQRLDGITRMLVGRERWIFEHPTVAMLVSSDESTARSVFRAILGIVQAVSEPEKMSLESLQQADFDQLIHSRSDLMAGHVHYLWSMSGLGLSPNVEVKKQDANSATVTATFQPQATANDQVELRFVEGRWVPAGMLIVAEDQEDSLPAVGSVQSYLSPDFSNNLAEFIDTIEELTLPLQGADNRQSFHAGIDRFIADATLKLLPILSSLDGAQNMFSGAIPGAKSADGADNYDAMMEMEMEMSETTP